MEEQRLIPQLSELRGGKCLVGHYKSVLASNIDQKPYKRLKFIFEDSEDEHKHTHEAKCLL